MNVDHVFGLSDRHPLLSLEGVVMFCSLANVLS